MEPITTNNDPETAVVAPAITPNTDPSVKYDSAVAARDPKQLYGIAQEHAGTPLGDAAVHAAGIITDTSAKFKEVFDPITKAGGAGTPAGNLAIVNQWKTNADDPKWGTALLKWAMGDKAGAALQITGGDVKDNITFDNSGKRILEKVNALGQRQSVTDLATGQPISPEEYQQRGGGFSSWENTLAGKRTTEIQNSNVKALQKSNEVNNAWAATIAGQSGSIDELNSHLDRLAIDLPATQNSEILKFVSNSMGRANSNSKNKSMLDQWTQGSGFTVGQTVDKSVASGMGLEGVWHFDGKGGISDSNGNHKDFGQLAMRNTAESSSAENTANYQQTQANLMQYAKTAHLSDTDVTKMQRALEIAHQIGNENLAMTSQYGKPLFLSLPGASSIMDKQGQIKAQALQMKFNADAMPLYQEYARQSAKDHEAINQAPNPNEMESGFTRTPEYKALKQKYAAQIENIYKNTYVNPNIPMPEETPAKTAPVKPKAKRSLSDLIKQFGG